MFCRFNFQFFKKHHDPQKSVKWLAKCTVKYIVNLLFPEFTKLHKLRSGVTELETLGAAESYQC